MITSLQEPAVKNIAKLAKVRAEGTATLCNEKETRALLAIQWL